MQPSFICLSFKFVGRFFWLDYNNTRAFAVLPTTDVTGGPMVFYFTFVFLDFWGIRNWRARLGKDIRNGFRFISIVLRAFLVSEPG